VISDHFKCLECDEQSFPVYKVAKLLLHSNSVVLLWHLVCFSVKEHKEINSKLVEANVPFVSYSHSTQQNYFLANLACSLAKITKNSFLQF
jgi:hypothetical protein